MSARAAFYAALGASELPMPGTVSIVDGAKRTHVALYLDSIEDARAWADSFGVTLGEPYFHADFSHRQIGVHGTFGGLPVTVTGTEPVPDDERAQLVEAAEAERVEREAYMEATLRLDVEPTEAGFRGWLAAKGIADEGGEVAAPTGVSGAAAAPTETGAESPPLLEEVAAPDLGKEGGAATDKPVWVATRREGIDYHAFGGRMKTGCGRSTLNGLTLTYAFASTFAKPCPRCYPRDPAGADVA